MLSLISLIIILYYDVRLFNFDVIISVKERERSQVTWIEGEERNERSPMRRLHWPTRG